MTYFTPFGDKRCEVQSRDAQGKLIHVTIKNMLNSWGTCFGYAIRYLPVKVSLLRVCAWSQVVHQRCWFKMLDLVEAKWHWTCDWGHDLSVSTWSKLSFNGPIQEEMRKELNPYCVVASWSRPAHAGMLSHHTKVRGWEKGEQWGWMKEKQHPRFIFIYFLNCLEHHALISCCVNGTSRFVWLKELLWCFYFALAIL